MELERIIAGITAIPKDQLHIARQHWNTLAKPLGSLGVLEEDISRIAALQAIRMLTDSVNCSTGHALSNIAEHSEDAEEQLSMPRLDHRTLLVFCSDNGVVQQGVSQSDASVTTAVATALGRGDSTVNYMAQAAHCNVLPVDIGMQDKTPAGVLFCKVMAGTADITQGPAMTREACLRAILMGAQLVAEQVAQGADILLLGEMGIGNTTTATAVASVLLGHSAESLTGRGAGLSDDGLRRKVRAIDAAIHGNAPNPEDPVDVLAKVGGLDLAALCGACLGAARARVPVLLDGVITNAAALCAVRLCPAVRDVLIASHVSQEPAAERLLEALALEPCIAAGLHLGEGSGAVLALPLLDQALAVYRSGHTFDALGIEAYTAQS